MNSASTTNFLNAKGRRIYQGKSGGFFVMKSDGTKKYKPTAAFRQVGNSGAKSKVTSANANVPKAIARKVRKNAGVKRGARTPDEGNLTRKLLANYNKPAAKKAGPAKRPGRKPTTAAGMMKAGMSPNAGDLTRMLLANYNKPKAGPRKVRKNKGTVRTPTEAALFRKIFASPKARKPAAKKAGPAKRPGRKPTTAAGMMKAGMSPNAGDLTRMLLKTPPAKKSPKARAAPKSRVMKAPKPTRPVLNLIVVSPGGTSKVQKIRKPRSALGAMKKGLTPNAGDLTRMLLKTPPTKKPRKVRKNKGVKRGPRGIKGMRTNANPFQALA